ncbi:hypothetical protein ACQKKX_14240 [Neorhizobium sp. NPDC001467]|uniref:hypothetical protein n=1 Tax=Neorhizobium sp. NPDC001467 TaxID=3390595 RepID=UPI003D081363
MTPEARQALADRIFDKARRSGQTIDNDPLFVRWMEEWISGDIDMAVLRERYRTLLVSRRRQHSQENEPS